MKEKELRKHSKCVLCGKKILASGIPLFWKVTVERLGVKVDAVNRQSGLSMMIGAQLAEVMGPDEDLTQPMMEPVVLTICETCGTDSFCVAELAERGSDE